MILDASGNLGIGTTTPQTRLDIAYEAAINTTTPGITLYNLHLTPSSRTPTNAVGITFGADTSAGVTAQAGIYSQFSGSYGTKMYFATTDSYATGAKTRMAISHAGGIGIGTTADPGGGAVYATGNITAYYSDARMKTVSGTIDNALDKIGKLKGVYYTNNNIARQHGYTSDEIQVGVLAQDVETVLPEIVKAAPFDLDENNQSRSGEHYKTVQYERLIPLLIEAIKELKEEIKILKGNA
jgi:hypothetical protein